MTITLSQAEYWSLFQDSVPKSLNTDDFEWSWIFPFPSVLGQGVRRDFLLRRGISLVIEDTYFRDDFVIQHRDRAHPIEYTFEQINDTGKTQHRYRLYGSGLAPEEAHLRPGQVHTLSVNVHIEPEVFQHWMGPDTTMPKALQSLTKSPEERYYEQTGTPTPAMQMTLQQILNCPFQGLTQRLYLESKAWELMALLVDDLATPESSHSCTNKLKPDDVERIYYASKILQKQLLNPPSLMELARAAGINDHKLKVGFRQVFDTTVFGYLHDRRMERSRQLLESGNINVTEAARAVGFANRGHFAAAFRRKFGMNPGVYARAKRA